MRRPRFALSVMLGAMALSLAALGIPPYANDPAAGRDSPNAALICPTSSLASESHPFRWFETADGGHPCDVFDGWVRTVLVPQYPPSRIRLENCDLSVAFRQTSEAVATRLALDLCGLAWIADLGVGAEPCLTAQCPAGRFTADASELAADYRHSTGQSELLRINRREGRTGTCRAGRRHGGHGSIAQNSQPPSGAFPDDFPLAGVGSAPNSYERFYCTQHSADAVAAWVRALTRELTSGLSEIVAHSVAAAEREREPLHAVSIVHRDDESSRTGQFELVREEDSRFTYLRWDPSADDGWAVGTDISQRREASFEPLIDGPKRFLYLRTDGAQAPPRERSRALAVILPRPFPPGSAIGIDTDWLAWEYFTLQVTDKLEPTADGPILEGLTDAGCWENVSWTRNQDTPREQIEAEESASAGDSDAAQPLIQAQAEAEGVDAAKVPGVNAAEMPDLPHAPPGCHGSDPVGCLSLRSQMQAQRWGTSAAWTLTRLAAVLEHCASLLRETVANPTAPGIEPPDQPPPLDSTQSGGWLEPLEHTTASQRFLSELYLGL